jgi:hypothetical protein
MPLFIGDRQKYLAGVAGEELCFDVVWSTFLYPQIGLVFIFINVAVVNHVFQIKS